MKNIFATFFLALFALTALAQFEDEIPENRRAEIEAQRVAYITNRLQLTPEESQVFWPVYNAYQNELKQHRKNRLPGGKMDTESIKGMSDAEIDALVKQRFEAERAKVALDEKYYEKIKKLLPMWKVAELYKAEQGFRRELLKALRDRAGGGRMRGN